MVRRAPRLAALLAGALLALPARGAAGDRFLPDDPLREDPDRLPVPLPAEVELGNLYDFLENTFAHHPDGPAPAAVNANSLGEVPDSSWFTNRIGVRALSVEEAAAGPRPDVSGPSGEWTVVAGKSGGITPGFTVRDGKGDVYFVKFDPAAHAGLSTGADAVGSRLFHLLGYNVPANYVAAFRREDLRIAPDARVRDMRGKKRPLTEADLDFILGDAARLPDGRVRCVASLRLAGRPLGPFRYHGTRPDDPNDVFPHEHRRELRGLRLLAAWLNHDDSRSINTLDVYEGEPGRGHVRHYLIDFSSTLGSGSNAERRIAPQNPRAGNEYALEAGPALRSALTLGWWDRPWRKVRYPDHPEVGRIEAGFFRPERWRPEYPNPAFDRLRGADAFWAARLLARVEDALVRAAVRAGEYRDPDAESYLVATLLARRDKVVAHYLRQTSPLDGFRVVDTAAGRAVAWEHLGEARGLGRVAGYRFRWHAFDNATGEARPLGGEGRTAGARAPLPSGLEGFARLDLEADSDVPGWRLPVRVYLRPLPRGRGHEVVGIEREDGE